MSSTKVRRNWLFPDCSVVIPSKNRSCKQTAAKLLPWAKILVEPQDVISYEKAGHGDRLVVLPKNDGGIVYARNFILQNSEGRVLQVDDDVCYLAKFTYVNKGFLHYRSCDAHEKEAMCESVFSECKGISFPLNKNKCSVPGRNTILRAWAFVCLDADVLRSKRIAYREEATLFEDYDIQLQALYQRADVACLLGWAFGCPIVGSNPGGLNDGLRNKNRQEASVNFMLSQHCCLDVARKSRGLELRFIPSDGLFVRKVAPSSLGLERKFDVQVRCDAGVENFSKTR